MLSLAILVAPSSAAAQTGNYKLIHDFTGPDGDTPIGDLISDASGNLYGVTKQAADFGYSCGTVYELSPTSSESWKRTVLRTFTGQWSDCNPWAGLVMDKAGNLYGTAVETYGFGAVYELSPASSGQWNYNVIHQFQGGSDGIWPLSKLTLDAAGNVYGTTQSGPLFGTVFELSATASGEWTENILYNFANGSDGGNPAAGVIFDAAGNLYGTTQNGGNQSGICENRGGCGVVFELSPSPQGWTETTLHTFNGTDGAFPQANLIMDASGSLYGMTYAGGDTIACTIVEPGCGVAFKLSTAASGKWTYSTILTFQPGPTGHGSAGGAYPWSGLTFDTAGNLWGTTAGGGLAPDYLGIVFKLSPKANGQWAETVVHSFSPAVAGYAPFSGITFGADGNAFGTTSAGGALNRCAANGNAGAGCGLVFEFAR